MTCLEQAIQKLKRMRFSFTYVILGIFWIVCGLLCANAGMCNMVVTATIQNSRVAPCTWYRYSKSTSASKVLLRNRATRKLYGCTVSNAARAQGPACRGCSNLEPGCRGIDRSSKKTHLSGGTRPIICGYDIVRRMQSAYASK